MESCRELKENNPYLFNSWRSILYTEKGRKAGVVNDWRKFPVFYENVVPCCYVCNCARNNNFSFDEMKILGKTIKKIMEDRLNGNGN